MNTLNFFLDLLVTNEILSRNNEPGCLGFSKKATTDDVLRSKVFSGYNIIITGTTSGLGKDTARVFYKRGATVFSFNRNMKKTEKSHRGIVEEVERERMKGNPVKPGKLISIQCDLSSLASIRKAVSFFREKYADVLVNILFLNAGVMWLDYGHTVDGFELQMGINHFGHFLLTMLLLPYLKEPSHIHITSSIAHELIPNTSLDFDDLHCYKRTYSKYKAYGHSKLANIYFTKELNRLLQLSNKKIIVNCSHPGLISTNLGSTTLARDIGWFLSGLAGWNKTIQEGASTQVLVATSEKVVSGGHYFVDNDRSEPSDVAKDMSVAKKLFKISLLDTESRFPFDIDGEDVNNLEDEKSSLPPNWKGFSKVK